MVQGDQFHPLEASGDLLRAPVGMQTDVDDEPDFIGQLDRSRLTLVSFLSQTVCLLMTISPQAGVWFDLTGNAAG